MPERRAAGLARALCAALVALLPCGAPAAPPGAAAAGCEAPADALERVQCSGRLRVGVRSDYPSFAAMQGETRTGFEIDLARALAARLGVQPVFSTVTPANRLAVLGEGRVDLVIATMGHTVLRDSEARFVRPHYYQSRTIVVGERRRALDGMDAIAGRTVCVTVGNNTNAELAERGARLMLFGNVQQLIDQLALGACPFAAQDDSLFAHHFLRPEFAARNDVKFGLAPLPWGMAVGIKGGERLAQQLGQALRELHADGTLVRLARTHGVDTAYLEREQVRWREPPCRDDATLADPRCIAQPHDNRLQPTAFAGAVQRFEDGLRQRWDIEVTLAMLKTRIALKLFLQGIGYSLALVAGAVAATVAVSLAFAAGMSLPGRWVRWPLRLLQMTMQSTPLVLLMLFAAIGVSAWGAASGLTALATAIVVLGLFNGSNGGQAIAEARSALRHSGEPATLRDGVRHARAQLVAFVVNATRGSPAASIIGVPELLSAQTDIASFSSERTTTFTLLLIFYMAVVSAVVWLGRRWEARLAAGEAREEGAAP